MEELENFIAEFLYQVGAPTGMPYACEDAAERLVAAIERKGWKITKPEGNDGH